MRILILAQHYAPEEVSGAVLATELSEDLVQRGHQVTFVTSAPSYPQGVVFTSYRNALLSREDRNGVQILRVWSFISTSKSFWPRILNYGTFCLMAFLGGLAAGKVDVIMSASPPLPLGISAWLVSRLRRIPWLLRVEDLYPQAAVAAEVLRNRLAIRFFEGMEKFIYRRASHISLISESFRQDLITKGVASNKLSVLPVWSDPDNIQPLPKENRFRQDNNLTGKFVLLYSGNLGHNSALEDIIDAANHLKAKTEITFMIVGEGVKKAALQRRAQHYGLDNIIFLPYQPREEYAVMLAAADLSIVTLNRGSSHTSMPSKTFNIMASGRPVLAVVDDCSEVAQLVHESNCGLVVLPNQPEILAERIMELCFATELLNTWGANGRQVLERYYSRERCTGMYEASFQQMQQNFSSIRDVKEYFDVG